MKRIARWVIGILFALLVIGQLSTPHRAPAVTPVVAAERVPESTAAPVEDIAAKRVATLADYTRRLAEVKQRLADNRARERKYYPSAEQMKQGLADTMVLEAIETVYADGNQEEKALARQAAALLAQVARQSRVMYAALMEQVFLKNGLNVEVKTTGSNGTTLHLRYALMSKALVYQFQNKWNLDESAAPYGFRRIEYTDGYTGTWSANTL